MGKTKVEDYTGCYCADCNAPLWEAEVFKRPTAERSVVALVCEGCFMQRPFGAVGGWTEDNSEE